MPPLPDRPNSNHLRAQARELLRAARVGDPGSVARFAAHGLAPDLVTLRRAQQVLAREYGFGSWAQLMTAVDGGGLVENRAPARGAVEMELMALAHQFGGRFVRPELLLLLATDPNRGDHVEAAGFDREALARRLALQADHDDDTAAARDGLDVTDPARQWLATAAGLGASQGRPVPAAVDLLLAFLYNDAGGLLPLTGLEPDEVAEHLTVTNRPSAWPPALPAPRSPWGNQVYFPSTSSSPVFALLRDRYPPGQGLAWGMNQSHWRTGDLYVFGEDDIPLADLVLSVVDDPSQVMAVAFTEAIEREAAARRGGTAASAERSAPPANGPGTGTGHVALSRPSRSDVGQAGDPGDANAPGPRSSIDLDRHRAEARRLMELLRHHDPSARQRVLNAHPTYMNRNPSRLDPRSLNLVDGLATVAAEAGRASWAELVAAADRQRWGAPRTRWRSDYRGPAHGAMHLAIELGHPTLQVAHVALALMRSPAPTLPALLGRLGVDEPTLLARLGPPSQDVNGQRGITSTPDWHRIVGWSTGLALGRGSDHIEPPDVLAALAYAIPAAQLRDETGLDPNAVHQALIDAGHPQPDLPPSSVEP